MRKGRSDAGDVSYAQEGFMTEYVAFRSVNVSISS
jgi:hypothetical protein